MTQLTEAPTGQAAQPAVAPGVELLGRYEDSGFKDPPYLARRADGQTVQLTELLHLVAEHADGRRSYDEIAAAVSDAYGKAVSADNVRTLVEDRLRPLGILANADGSAPALEKTDPLLALRLRATVIPEHLTPVLAKPFKPLFWPPVVLAALAAIGVFDWWLFLEHGIAQSLRRAMYEPTSMLLVLGLVILSAAWHEFGHAAACAYGGARPGRMGAGVYVAYPAFFTDVTDAYRLGRGGRLRTDLAGVYFNVLFVLATAGAYALTGYEPLLLVIVVQHLEMAHQLLPVLRLDGYYVIADLTGVPDLFSRIKPILASLSPFTKTDERVTALKWWARAVVTGWVLVVVPLIVLQLGLIAMHAPRIYATGWDALRQHLAGLGDGIGGTLTAGLGVVLVALPLIGIAYTFSRLLLRAWRWGAHNTGDRPVAGFVFGATFVAVVGAVVFTWLPNGDYEPIRPGERGTLREAVRNVRDLPRGRPAVASLDQARLGDDSDGATTTASSTTTTTTVAGSAGDQATTTTSSPDATSRDGRITTTTEAQP